MRTTFNSHTATWRPSPLDRVGLAAAGMRDWLDQRGRPAWLAAMIVGFVAAWPVGLAILGYMIWSKRMFGYCHPSHRSHRHGRSCRDNGAGFGGPSTGNAAFDAYRTETLRRLEQEHDEFLAFLARLREAKDKAEFDQFMQQRRDDPAPNE